MALLTVRAAQTEVLTTKKGFRTRENVSHAPPNPQGQEETELTDFTRPKFAIRRIVPPGDLSSKLRSASFEGRNHQGARRGGHVRAASRLDDGQV